MNESSSSLHGFYAYTDTLKGVYYGPGCVSTALPALLGSLSVSRVLVVTGHSLQHKTDVVKNVEGVLKQQNAYGGTFWEIGEHAPIEGIKKGIKVLKDIEADVIVSVGGGSPIDASKAIIFNLQKESGGAYMKHIAIPTTLSAAEYTVGAGFTNENGEKTGVSSPFLAPAAVILDAELTMATPDKLWVSTGIRSLDHAIETLYRPLVPHPVKALCYLAIADLFKYLPKSLADPRDIQVRQRLQIAAWMSLWPLQLKTYSALGLSHALGHRLGAKYGIAHGITSCLTLAPTIALESEVASHENKQYLADTLFYIQVPSTGSVDGDILKLSSEVSSLVERLGLKTDLGPYNVPKTDVPKIAELALGGKDDRVYPKVVKLLEGLYQG